MNVIVAFFMLVTISTTFTINANATEKHALLVGCTSYPNGKEIPELFGPANDIPLWHKLLTSPSPGGFAFPTQNVQLLLGWPQDTTLRPTRDNIAAAFDALIATSKPGSQIVIVLSGHGTQQPIPVEQDPFDPQNPEPDGLDEVFLPADATEGSPVIENGIIDNQIGTWLEQMRSKGANVWIVFDCCHSGTMTRSIDDDGERSRNVEPTKLGISPQSLEHAARRAEAAAKNRSDKGLPPFAAPEEISARSNTSDTEDGSLVAFYAAQPFEKAPELPLPAGQPHSQANFYGLLSYTLVQTLLERRSPLSYRELSRLLTASYRARRGTRFPTPFAEGDLDLEVLSSRQWPLCAELLIERNRERLELNAGELHGLTVDSVLAVHPPINDTRDPTIVLGYVTVKSVSPSTAVVESCTFKGMQALTDVPQLSRCTIASRNFGEMRIKIYVEPKSPLEEVLKAIDRDVADQIQIANIREGAGWSLEVVAPAAASEYGIRGSVEDQVVLLPGAGRQVRENLPATTRKYFAAYPMTDTQRLVGDLERDLPKLFRWQNLWRVSSGVNAMDGGETHDLKIGALKLSGLQDQEGEPLRGSVLRSGDLVRFTLRNDGIQNLWVTVLYLDSDFGVKRLSPGPLQIEARRALKPFTLQMTADGNSGGQEGLIVFVSPATDKTAPDFSFLEQEPILVASERTRGIGDVPSTPFGHLLKTAAFNSGTRGMEPVVVTTPAVLTQTWLLIP